MIELIGRFRVPIPTDEDGSKFFESQKMLSSSADAVDLKAIDSQPIHMLQKPAVTKLVTGQLFARKYKILGQLGEGGMSVVYKAEDVILSRTVALKILHAGREYDATGIRRFQQEARAVSRLDDRHIVRVFDFGFEPGEPLYLVLEYIAGRSLADELEENGRLSVAHLIEIMLQVCDGLAHAHEHGVIHRDMKPSNIMLAERGKDEVVRIVDFGIAKIAPKEGEAVALTQTGEVFGSPLYMSPEQCLGRQLDARADIYSLGCIMYEALCGMPPLTGENAVETIYKHCQEQPVPPTKVFQSPDRMESIELVVMRCLEKKPEDRYPSASALKHDLLLLKEGRMPNAGSTARRKQLTRKIAFAFLLMTAALAVIAYRVSTPRSKSRVEPAAVLPSDTVSSRAAEGLHHYRREAKAMLALSVQDAHAYCQNILFPAARNASQNRQLALSDSIAILFAEVATEAQFDGAQLYLGRKEEIFATNAWKRGEFSEAKRLFEQALLEYQSCAGVSLSDRIRCHTQLGLLDEAVNSRPEAIDHFKAAIKLNLLKGNPHTPSALQAVADLEKLELLSKQRDKH